MKRIGEFFCFLILFFSFLFIAINLLDSDFGWHMRLGSLIVQHGVLYRDPFSYTMPSFPFIDHEWVLNVLFFFLYSHFGYVALAILFSLIGVLTLFISIKQSRSIFSLALIPLYASLFLPSFGVRTQVVSWLLLSTVLFIVFNKKVWKKSWFLIPLLMVLWVNLHGSFPILLVIVGIKMVADLFVDFILRHPGMDRGHKALRLLFKLFDSRQARMTKTLNEDERIIRKDFLIFLLSLFATFLNPYGWRIWYEVWSQISDSQLHRFISEWKSPIASPMIFFWIIYCLTLALVIVLRKFLSLFELLMFSFFSLLVLSATRHIPLWCIVSLFVLGSMFFKFEKEISKIKFAYERMQIIGRIFFGISFGVFFLVLYLLYPSVMTSSPESFPTAAVSFLHSHPPSGNILTVYKWGGYFDWKLPEKKVFIDGRMPSWRRSSAPQNESLYAFSEYNDLFVLGKSSLQKVSQKYQIDTLVLPVPQKQSSLDFVSRIRKLFHISVTETTNLSPIEKQIKKYHWIKIYQDSVAEVYRKGIQ